MDTQNSKPVYPSECVLQHAHLLHMLQRLKRVGAAILLGGVTVWMGGHYHLQYQFRQSDFVKESFKALKAYPNAEKLLGEDIRQRQYDLTDEFIKKDDQFGKMVIPVCGSKATGKLYSWTSKQMNPETQEEFWRVDRLDLMLEGYTPFTFFLRPEVEYVHKFKLDEDNVYREY